MEILVRSHWLNVEQLSETVERPVGWMQSGPLCIKYALGYIIMRLREPAEDEAT